MHGLLSQIGEPLAALSGDAFARLRGPIVYALVRDAEVLYIGYGRNGIRRPLDESHHRIREMLPSDSIFIWSFTSCRDAARLEASLIRQLRPIFNVALPASIPAKQSKGPGMWMRDNSWYVEFMIHGIRYRKSLGRVPVDIAKRRAAEYRLAVYAQLPPMSSLPIGKGHRRKQKSARPIPAPERQQSA